MSDKYVYCANCKTVFVMDADSHINECPACDVPNSTLEIPECVASELARRDELKAELAELNDKAVFIQFENEDELPSGIKDDVYSAMFECSHVDGVRLFPYIEENGQKYFLVMLREKEKPDENILLPAAKLRQAGLPGIT